MQMDEPMTRQQGIEKIAEIVKEIPTAMLVTMDKSGAPRSRPMATQSAPFDGTLWFFTADDSGKIDDLDRDDRVNVAYASKSESYLSVSGRAEVVRDRALIHEMWSPLLKSWFEGPDDPRLCLLRVDAEEAEYWDTPGGRVVSFLLLVKGAITGKGSEQGQHGVVNL
jgi:general stress protein 26